MCCVAKQVLPPKVKGYSFVASIRTVNSEAYKNHSKLDKEVGKPDVIEQKNSRLNSHVSNV